MGKEKNLKEGKWALRRETRDRTFCANFCRRVVLCQLYWDWRRQWEGAVRTELPWAALILGGEGIAGAHTLLSVDFGVRRIILRPQWPQAPHPGIKNTEFTLSTLSICRQEKCRFRKVISTAQSHRASKWQIQACCQVAWLWLIRCHWAPYVPEMHDILSKPRPKQSPLSMSSCQMEKTEVAKCSGFSSWQSVPLEKGLTRKWMAAGTSPLRTP